MLTTTRSRTAAAKHAKAGGHVRERINVPIGNGQLGTTYDLLPPAAAPVRYRIISPDGLPCTLRPVRSLHQAEVALTAWCARYVMQGYYSAVDGRIDLADLPSRCRIEPVEAV
jgi:hypothetical protein